MDATTPFRYLMIAGGLLAVSLSGCKSAPPKDPRARAEPSEMGSYFDRALDHDVYRNYATGIEAERARIEAQQHAKNPLARPQMPGEPAGPLAPLAPSSTPPSEAKPIVSG